MALRHSRNGRKSLRGLHHFDTLKLCRYRKAQTSDKPSNRLHFMRRRPISSKFALIVIQLRVLGGATTVLDCQERLPVKEALAFCTLAAEPRAAHGDYCDSAYPLPKFDCRVWEVGVLNTDCLESRRCRRSQHSKYRGELMRVTNDVCMAVPPRTTEDSASANVT